MQGTFGLASAAKGAPADHVRRNLPRTLGIKLVGAREVEPPIGPGHLRFHAGVKVRVGLDHYYASETVETTVGVTIIQPE